MRTPPWKSLYALITVLILSSAVSAASDVTVSPHSDSGDCSVCHVASVDKLRSWFTFGSTKRELKGDLNNICQRCHDVQIDSPDGMLVIGIGHATGKKTALNRADLPLDGSDKINCATTCHNMHIKSEDPHQQRKFLRLPSNSLCVSCHNM